MPEHVFKNPKQYSKNNALQYNFAMTMLSKVSFNPNSRILDIGCGDGVITNEIAQIVSKGCVIGTDVSSEMIEYASKQYQEQTNLRFVQMDAGQNIFRQQYDIVTSFNCLHWVRDQEKAIEGIATAAIEGAQIILLLSHKKSLYHTVLDSLCASDKWKSYFTNYINPRSFFDKSAYNEMLNKSGLKVDSLIEEEMIFYYQNPEEIKDFFRAAGSQIKLIPDNMKEEFLADFMKRYLQSVSFNEYDEIPLSFWCLQVISHKPVMKMLPLETEQASNLRLFSRL